MMIKKTLDPYRNKVNPLKSGSKKYYVDELFNHAYSLLLKYFPKEFEGQKSSSIGVELECDGLARTRVAYRLTSDVSVFASQHIGTLASIDLFDTDEKKFAVTFQAMLDRAFKCLGRRYDELDNDTKNIENSSDFEVIEQDQFPAFRFDAATIYTVDQLLSKFFEYTIKLFGRDAVENNVAFDLCIVCPSYFSTVKKIFLKEILNSLNVKTVSFIEKSIGLAASVLLETDMNDSECLVIEFSSGI
jgi:hypothetical protein